VQYEVAANSYDLHLVVKDGFNATTLLSIVLRVGEVTGWPKMVCGLLHVNSQSATEIHLMDARKHLITFMLKEKIKRSMKYGKSLLVSDCHVGIPFRVYA